MADAGRRVLIVTDDVLMAKMAGPAIRAWQMAEALAGHHQVRLVTASPTCEVESPRFEVEAAGEARFEQLERWCEVVIIQGYVLEHVPALRNTDRIMVVDLYDPLHFETLEFTRGQPASERPGNVATSVRVLREQIGRGDFFVCASEKQRDLWLGFLSALGRVNPATYDADPELRQLIDVAPFGLPPRPPMHDRAALRGVVPGIERDDEVILWGGGIHDWMDPVTLVAAVDRLRKTRRAIRCVFLGTRHPNTAITEARTSLEARRVSDELGLTGTHVFFNDGWVPYDERHNFLLEADLGVSLHSEHVETAFSFRTRILDYLWASLPVVSTRGDGFAGLIEQENLGLVVPGGDVAAVASAIETLLSDTAARQSCAGRAALVSARFHWESVLRPLTAFCDDARHSPDWCQPAAQPSPPHDNRSRMLPAGLYQDLRVLAEVYRKHGATGVVAGAAKRARHLARRAPDASTEQV